MESQGRKQLKSGSSLSRYHFLTMLADVHFISSESWKDRARGLDFLQERPTGSFLSGGYDQVSASAWFLLTHKAWLPVLWSRENLSQCLLALCPKPRSSGLDEFDTVQILSGLIAGVWPRLSGLVLDFLRILDTAPFLERSEVRGGRTLTATQRWNLFIILTRQSLTIFRNWLSSFSHRGRKFLSAHLAGY